MNEIDPHVEQLECIACEGCIYQFTLLSPSERVIGCNRYQSTQVFRTDSVIALSARMKILKFLEGDK